MRRAPQLGQNPRRLQLKATSRSKWQDSQRTRDAAVGAVIDSRIVGLDPVSGFAGIDLGGPRLRVRAEGLAEGRGVRVQVLARDVIVATAPPAGLSVRNVLPGTVCGVEQESAGADLVTIATGSVRLLARITREATVELGLRPGVPVWALVKAVSLQGLGA
jgi:molybdate transport system ATP-binding protein